MYSSRQHILLFFLFLSLLLLLLLLQLLLLLLLPLLPVLLLMMMVMMMLLLLLLPQRHVEGGSLVQNVLVTLNPKEAEYRGLNNCSIWGGVPYYILELLKASTYITCPRAAVLEHYGSMDVSDT